MLKDESLYCWGTESVFGDRAAARLTPSRIATIAGVAQIRMYQTNNCAILADGSMKCWGHDQSGELGVPSQDGAIAAGAVPQPTLVSLADQIVHVTMSDGNTCVVRRDGGVRCWGQLARSVGRTVDLAVSDSVSAEFMLGPLVALGADGSLSSWMWSSDAPPSLIDRVASETLQVSGDTVTGCALTKDSTVHCWSAFKNDPLTGVTAITARL